MGGLLKCGLWGKLFTERIVWNYYASHFTEEIGHNAEHSAIGSTLVSTSETEYETELDTVYTVCSLALPAGKWLLIGSLISAGNINIVGSEYAALSRCRYRDSTNTVLGYTNGNKTVSMKIEAKVESNKVYSDDRYCYLRAIRIG